jgi:hypothetical protein
MTTLENTPRPAEDTDPEYNRAQNHRYNPEDHKGVDYSLIALLASGALNPLKETFQISAEEPLQN